MKGHFDGQLETRNRPKSVTTKEQLAQVVEKQSWLRSNNRNGGV